VAIQKFQDAGKTESLFALGFLTGRLFLFRATSAIRGWIAVEKQVLDARREFFKGRFQIDVIGVGGELKRALEDCRGGARAEATVEERTRPVRDDSGGIEIVLGAQAIASGASA